MKRSIVVCLASLLAMMAAGMAGPVFGQVAEPPVPTSPRGIATAPPAIQRLAAEIRGKDGQQMREIIERTLGAPPQLAGSGVLWFHWEVDGGIVRLPSGWVATPSFRSTGGTDIPLVATANRAEENLLGTFDMSTQPGALGVSTMTGLGSVRLRDDGTYVYRLFRANLGPGRDPFRDQSDNFFVRHPEGRFTINYEPGFSARTLLESLSRPTTICRIEFAASDGVARAVFSVAIENTGRLAFAAEQPLPFRLTKGLDNVGDNAGPPPGWYRWHYEMGRSVRASASPFALVATHQRRDGKDFIVFRLTNVSATPVTFRSLGLPWGASSLGIQGFGLLPDGTMLDLQPMAESNLDATAVSIAPGATISGEVPAPRFVNASTGFSMKLGERPLVVVWSYTYFGYSNPGAVPPVPVAVSGVLTIPQSR